ncbi:hypothetical protein L207DRAFT_599223 [Hyaloscypha variabilis F]|uniref:DUF7918 domain-containing protein n=1 Tax=Hyaloscypha variabilis (strain UAMH 11265 / GT02V1 / F) TaxID=1149755 RepID=A0A2J6RIW2_HYAVF|nr:hypothetical protein L207DRAFT_599223 [Hyaloscypha variabilis F]
MAVLKGLEGIEVTVRVDNSALHEYNDDEVSNELVPIGEYQASKTVSKYIEAFTGKEFTIVMTVRALYQMDCPTLSFRVMVDGNHASNPLLRKSNYRGNNWEKKVAGIRHQLEGPSKRCSIKKFLFAEIQTTEDQAKLCSIKDDAKRIGEVGEISVRVFRKSESITSQKIFNCSLNSSPGGAVHEKALKGQSKSHGTSLGAAQPAKAGIFYHSEYLDGFDKPIGVFRFKYRSREALKNLLIIERTPEPEAAGEENNIQAKAATTQTLNSDNATTEGTRSTTSTTSRGSTNSFTTLILAAAPCSAASAKTEDSGNDYTIKDEESKEGVLESIISTEGSAIKRECGESEPSRRT